jgi:hypothetical protein
MGTGTGGSNLQRTSSLKDPLPRALGDLPKSLHAARESAEEAPETIKQANWLYLRFTTLSFRDGATPSVKLKTSRCRTVGWVASISPQSLLARR